MTKKHDDTKKLEQQLAELTDALQRERADATNVRRRAEEERMSMTSFHRAGVVRELLPVIDNFERALKHVPDDLKDNDYIKGVNGIAKQFEEVLTKLGVERIKTVGEAFDPNLHNAVSHEEGSGPELVSEELQAGYRMGDEVIRHAMVRVKS